MRLWSRYWQRPALCQRPSVLLDDLDFFGLPFTTTSSRFYSSVVGRFQCKNLLKICIIVHIILRTIDLGSFPNRYHCNTYVCILLFQVNYIIIQYMCVANFVLFTLKYVNMLLFCFLFLSATATTNTYNISSNLEISWLVCWNNYSRTNILIESVL